jgi:RNA polymerase sigma-70 factor (ECF subfamily)
VLKVHESTISRKLEKLTAELRKSILSSLMKTGMSRRQAEEAFDVDVRDVSINLRTSLQEEGAKPFLSEKEER